MALNKSEQEFIKLFEKVEGGSVLRWPDSKQTIHSIPSPSDFVTIHPIYGLTFSEVKHTMQNSFTAHRLKDYQKKVATQVCEITGNPDLYMIYVLHVQGKMWYRYTYNELVNVGTDVLKSVSFNPKGKNAVWTSELNRSDFGEATKKGKKQLNKGFKNDF